MKVKLTKEIRIIAELTVITAIFLLVGGVVRPAKASSQTITSQANFLSGKYEFNGIDIATSAGSLQLQLNLGTWDATGPAYLNHYVYTNSKIIKVGSFVYIFRNRYLGQLIRYDLETREFKEMSYAPSEPYEVLDATTNGTDTIWAIVTRSGKAQFVSYYIPTNTWTMLDPVSNTLNQGSTIEYAGAYIYAVRAGGTTNIYKYTIATNAWSSVQNTTFYCTNYCDMSYDGTYMWIVSDYWSPNRLYRWDMGSNWVQKANVTATIGYGSDLTLVGADSLYLMRSNGTNSFYRYSITDNVWYTVANVPTLTTYGSLAYDADNSRIIALAGMGEMFYYYPGKNGWSSPLAGPLNNNYAGGKSLESDGNNNLYLCRAQGQQTCYTYHTLTNTWAAITNVTGAMGEGSAIASASGRIYATQGANGTGFYSYENNVWTTRTAIPGALNYGGAMVASGSATIWALRGSGTTTLYRYDIALNSWLTKGTTVALGDAVGRGGGLVSAPAPANGGKALYALTGNNRGKFYRYYETIDTWTEMASLPVAAYSGGGLTYDGGNYIYAMAGGENDINGRQMYRYDINRNIWDRVADTPAMMRYGGYLTWHNNTIYAYEGYGGSLWKYTPPTGSPTYTTSGNWYSSVYDLTYVSAWGQITYNPTPQAGVTISTRVSNNNYTWDNWVATDTDGTILSERKRYLQVKVSLSGNGTDPVNITDLTINYIGDTTAPTFPNFLTAGFSATGSAQLTSGQTYSHRTPFFQWTDAIDAETDIDGYYVYFGTSDSANPAVVGNYQPGANYTVSTGLVTGSTYYLLIKAKNKAGVVSETASPYFSYVYSGISPQSTVAVATQADWDSNSATKSGVYTGTSDWWNQSYRYRQQLTITPAAYLGPGSTIKVTVDTASLESSHKLRADRKDWRVVYWDGNFWKEIDREYVDATTTYFYLQKGIAANASETNYYIYYGNESETISPMSTPLNYKFGQALYFGAGQRAQIPTVINGKSNLTIEGWFKYQNPNTNRWIYGGATTQVGIEVLANTNTLRYCFRTTGASSCVSNGTNYLIPNTWNHVAMTFNNTAPGTVKGYLNGVLDYSVTGLTGTVSVSTQQALGASGNWEYFYGWLDEIRISDNVRYPTNFTPQTTAFTTDPNTLALYHFDDGTGQTVTDSSGTGSNGFLGTNGTVEGIDPVWTGFTTASAGVETNATSSVNSNLTLEPQTSGSWAGYQLPSMPWGNKMYIGASAYINNELFVLRGNNTKTFYKLDLSTNTWTQLADAPGLVYYGAMAAVGTDTIYIMRGNGGQEFYSYTISTNTWTTLNPVSLVVSTGSSLVAVGTDTLYALVGGGTSNFLRYTISTGAWDTMATPTLTATYGSGLAYDGNNSIYAVFGSGVGFARYYISGQGIADTWDYSMPYIPHYIGYSSNNATYYNGYVYTFTSYDYQANNERKNFLWRYNTTTMAWESYQLPADIWLNYGANAYDGSRYLYLVQGATTSGGGNTAVYRYDLQLNKFLPETPIIPIDRNYTNDGEQILYSPYTGTSLAYDDSNNVYMALGATQWVNKYTVSTKLWTRLPALPCYYYGGGLVYVNNFLYAICGNTKKDIYRYNEGETYWERLTDAPNTIGAGGSQGATWALTNGIYSIYVLRGIATQTLYRYDINGANANTWTTINQNIPGTIGNSWGASISSDGTDNVYILRGNNSASLYKYSISGNAMSTLNSAPENIGYGSGSVYVDGKIYVMTGENNNGFYIYDTVNGVWSFGPLTMSQVYAGGALTKGPGNSLYALQGNYTYTFWKYNLPTSSSSFKYTGTYTTKPLDLGNPYAFVGLEATVSSPSATSVTFSTRTSTDSASWSSWAEATNIKQIPTNLFTYSINSTVNRYVQVQAVMTSDESVETPIISDINIHYYNDSDNPTNPTTIHPYRSSTHLTSEIEDYKWLNYSTPYFTWSGDSDATGSGVLGYYVYFGSNANADPVSTPSAFTTNSNYTASLATDGSVDGEYYLKIKAKDNSGNVSSNSWSPYHYRYDKKAPSVPTSASADPRAYSNTNDYTMFWLATSDVTSNATSSGLLGYYYKTATPSGELSTNQFTAGTQVSGITAYQEGKNTFSVQTTDIAGNTSEYAEVSYYYGGSAPSAPVDLEVNPSIPSTSNSFAFVWNEPESYQGSISEYRYSINSKPTALNYSATTSRMLSAGAYATVKGTNTFYVVAVDEAGNVNYDNYASVEFVANTTAPGIPQNIESFDNSIRSTGQYKVGLTWDAPTSTGSALSGYAVYGSSTATDCSTSMTGFTLTGTTAGTSYVVTTLGGTALTSATYYFCVKAYDSTSQYSAASTTVSLLPTGKWLTAPDLSADPTSTVKTKSAIIVWTTSRAANSFVKYGTSSGSYGNEVGSSTQSTSHSISLTNLSPGTKYYYKVLWTDEDGNEGSASEATLTTNAAPSVSGVKASDINLYSAYITFTVKNSSSATIQYGKTSSYGAVSTLTTSTTGATYTVKLDSLSEGTTYHYRIVAKDEELNEFTGDDYTFNTLPLPKITTAKIQQVIGTPTATVRLIWISNTEISSIVTYYPSTNPEQARDQINLALTKNHILLLKDLKDDSDYKILIKGRDVAGNEATYTAQEFKTATDVRAPQILDFNVETSIIGAGETAKAQIIVTWNTDELGTTQVEYGEGTGTSYSSKTQEDNNLTLNHSVTIPDVVPSKIYHLRALSKDKSGNSEPSFDMVVITPKATKSALNLVVDSLSKTFGFLEGLNLNQ